MACVKELGGLESIPQDKFHKKAGRVEKTVGFNPPPPTTKSLGGIRQEVHVLRWMQASQLTDR